MKLDTRQRWLIVAGLVTATLAAAAWVRDNSGTQTSEVVSAADRTERPRAVQTQTVAQSEAPHVNLEKLKSRSLGESGRDPFAGTAPRPVRIPAAPPPPTVAAAPAPPPPAPRAPPLPFTYMGKLLSGEDAAIFLIHGDRNLIVREGDTIDSVYRIERIAESDITLTYLPLNQQQRLDIGAPK